jgi:hypothetical protein
MQLLPAPFVFDLLATTCLVAVARRIWADRARPPLRRERHTGPMAGRVALLTAVVPVIVSCSVFDELGGGGSRRSDFPDAGPGGPDSLYAGIGQGIPWGESGLEIDQLRAPVTGAMVPVSRGTVGAVLRAARAHRIRLILNLAGSRPRYQNPDGTFNFETWKARIDTYRDVDFAPYVTEGLILAHYLMDEPGAAKTWGGQRVSRAVIDSMARYSKSIWPSLPTLVRATPSWLATGDTNYHDLDIAWAQWAGPNHGGSRGDTPESFRDRNVAYAKRLGLGLVVGLNYIDGGDGSSGLHGSSGRLDWWQMSAGEIQRVGTVLAGAPYVCAFISWYHQEAFVSRPDIRPAIDSVTRIAAVRGGTSCVRHPLPGDSLAPPDSLLPPGSPLPPDSVVPPDSLLEGQPPPDTLDVDPDAERVGLSRPTPRRIARSESVIPRIRD